MALEGQVITCKTVDEWRENLARANDSKKLVVAYFTAAWCPPCRMIAPVVEDLAKKFTFVLFLKVGVDELKTVAEEWEVEAMPTFIFIKEGNVVHRVVGAVKDELVAAITKHGSA